MCRDRKTGHLSKPKLFNVKLRLMRHTDHKNGTPSEASRPKLVNYIVKLPLDMGNPSIKLITMEIQPLKFPICWKFNPNISVLIQPI